MQVEFDLFQIEDDFRDILDDIGKRGELMGNAFNSDSGDCSAFKGRHQDSAQGIADGMTEPALKRSSGKLRIRISCGLLFHFKLGRHWKSGYGSSHLLLSSKLKSNGFNWCDSIQERFKAFPISAERDQTRRRFGGLQPL